jgi:hypothetical protein
MKVNHKVSVTPSGFLLPPTVFGKAIEAGAPLNQTHTHTHIHEKTTLTRRILTFGAQYQDTLITDKDP